MDNSKHKLIFVNRFYWPDNSATSQLLTDLAINLADDENDFDVHVITSRLLYSNPNEELSISEVNNKVTIHRVFTSRFGRSNLKGRAIDYFSFYFFACLKLFFICDKRSLVIVKTDPPMMSIPCKLITILKKSRQLNWLQDIFPEIMEKLHPDTLPKFLHNILVKLRNLSLKYSYMNIVISNDMHNFLLNEGIPNVKISLIENWVDTDLIQPIAPKENSLAYEWGLADKRVVMYSGNMGRSHHINSIIYAANILSSEGDIVFLFVGGGAKKEEAKHLCKKLNLTNVIFKEYLPRELLSKSLSIADLHVVSLKKQLANYIYPSKLYGILAVGKPVIFIGDVESYLAYYVSKNKIGKAVDNNPYDIANAIESLFSNHSYLSEISSNARNLAVNEHSKFIAKEKWKNIIIKALQ